MMSDIKERLRNMQLTVCKDAAAHIATLEQESAANLQRALVAEKRQQGMILVSREAIERMANIDAFNAPVGAAMEIKLNAQMMLQEYDRLKRAAPDTSTQEVG